MKPFILLISFITLSLVSCEKQETRNFLKDIEGKWEMEKIVFGHNQNDPVSALDLMKLFWSFYHATSMTIWPVQGTAG